MSRLTKQERTVLGVIFSLLLLGLLVKTYRTAHPPAPVSAQAQK
ncbi:MAG: hypothetical protein ACTHKU_08420 [Verrucomicrobiota bacterium]